MWILLPLNRYFASKHSSIYLIVVMKLFEINAN